MVGISSKFPTGRPFHAQTQVEHVIVKPVMICTHARSWLMLAFALARRCQNESAHLELTLQRYASKSFTAESKSNPEALPGIVNAMWAKGINEKALTEAVEYSATALGTHARTGYLIAPVAVLSKNVPNRRSDRISKYLSEMRHRMLEAKVANVLDEGEEKEKRTRRRTKRRRRRHASSATEKTSDISTTLSTSTSTIVSSIRISSSTTRGTKNRSSDTVTKNISCNSRHRCAILIILE